MSPYTLLWLMSIGFCISKTDSTNATGSNLIPCKQGWFLFDKKCYNILGLETKSLDWKKASVHCSVERGSLATINSPELQDFLVMFLLLRIQKDAWIGLHDRVEENKFTWDDHSPVIYTNWDKYQPTGTGDRREQEDCVQMRFAHWRNGMGTWNDQSCDTELPYVCQADEREDVLSQDPRFCSVEEGEGWKYLNSCYHVVTEAKPWEDAENYCKEKYSGHLVAILDDKTEMFLNYLFSKYAKNFWIGIKMRDQGMQVWSSGVHVAYKKWNQEPKHFVPGTCSRMSKGNMWEIRPCFREFPFICEKSNYRPPLLKKPPEGWQCPVLSREWIDLDGEYCYLFETKKSLNWHEANYDCVIKGGTLASILSETESYALQPHVKSTQARLFIGLHRSLSNKDVFEWADGTKFDYTNWNTGEPFIKTEECGEILTDTMKWNDIKCDETKGYICSAKKVPPKTEKINASVPNECICPEMPTEIINASVRNECICPEMPPKTEIINASVPNECICPENPDLRCPELPTDGIIIIRYNMERRVNSKATFSCSKEGQELIGTSALTCLRSGEWSDPPPYCSGVQQCLLNLDPSSHLVIDPKKDGYRMGESIFLSCPLGEEMSKKVERLMCMGGRWSDSLPECIDLENKDQR